MAIGAMIKGEIFESICSLIGSTTMTTTGTMASTYQGPANTFQPYCEPKKPDACDPSFPLAKVTLTWTDSEKAGENPATCQVSYCGLLWYNGQTQQICPDEYTIDQTVTTISSHKGGIEVWVVGGNTNFNDYEASLKLRMAYRYSIFGGSTYTYADQQLIIARSDSSTYNISFVTWYNFGTPNVIYDDMGVMVVDKPSFNNYRIGDGMFVTFTDALTTITYVIERGDGW